MVIVFRFFFELRESYIIITKKKMDQTNKSIISYAIKLISDLFSQQEEFVKNEDGTVQVIKKPLRMVCLSMCVLCTFILVLLIVLTYKIVVQLINSVDALELIMTASCEITEEESTINLFPICINKTT